MSDSELDWGDDDVAENEQGGEDDWGDMVELDAADAAKAEERHQQQLPQHLLLLALLKAQSVSGSVSMQEAQAGQQLSSSQARHSICWLEDFPFPTAHSFAPSLSQLSLEAAFAAHVSPEGVGVCRLQTLTRQESSRKGSSKKNRPR